MNIISYPNSIGFWWMNATWRYGWEPVKVFIDRNGRFKMCVIGRDDEEDILSYHNEWIKLEEPIDIIKGIK